MFHNGLDLLKIEIIIKNVPTYLFSKIIITNGFNNGLYPQQLIMITRL